MRPFKNVNAFGCLGLIVAVIVGYFAINNLFYYSEYAEAMRQREAIQLQLEREQAQQQVARSQLWTDFTADSLDGLRDLGTVVFFVVVIGAVVFFAFTGTHIQWKRISNANRERYKVMGGGRFLIDTQTSEVIDSENGNVFASQSTPAKLLLQGQVSRIQALSDSGQRWNSNMGKTALGSWPTRELQTSMEPAQPSALAAPDEPEYDIELFNHTSQLMEYASAHQWVLGQNTKDGTLCEFNVKEDCNLLIFGQKSMGKTQLAMLLLAYARKNNWHIIVADGKEGVDFRKYADDQLIEWFPLDETNILRFMVSLDRIYKERLHLLSDARCAELDEYIAKTGNQLPRILVIVEEYGATIEFMRSIKELRKDANTVLALFGTIFKKARCTGVHIVTLDQTINDSDIYNNSIKANGLYVSYKLPAQQFRVFGLPQTVKFLERGHFIEETNHDDRAVKTFYTEGDLDLTQLPKQTFAPLIPELSNLSLVADLFERGQTTSCLAETDNDNGCDSLSQRIYNEPTTTYNDAHNQLTTSAFEEVDWAYFASIKGTGRNLTLRDELPKLSGEPIEVEEVQYVIDAYSYLSSKEAVYFAVWGFKDGVRMEWLNDVIEEYFPQDVDVEEE